MIRRCHLAGLLILPLAGCGPSPDPAAAPDPAVLVSVVRPQQGSLPQLIESYGTASPSANGQVTLSVPQPGQVTSIAVTPGAAVRAGQPIMTFAVSPSARASFLQAAEAFRVAQEQRRTTAQLLTQQLATRDQVAQAEKAVADARTTLAALQAEGAGAAATTLRAPFAGVVSTISAAPGDRTQPGQALATVARAGALVVTVGIDSALRDRLRIGATARLQRLDGGASSPAVPGRVVRVDAMLNPHTRQIDVDIGYPAGALLSGEAMRVSIEIGRASGWLVPHRAVATTADGKAQIFQVAGGRAKAVPVMVIATTAEQDAVTGPIEPARPSVVDGAYQVSAGDAVRTGKAP
ncbi:MAG: efflux transporter periplasmic adaptor subunit [Sphingomonas bacterium]|nr:efflux RND transporter periplasmic adaptor subunit [Sphingomonas bacterium]MDB5688750.1 efflux transporter periplasmic adaptor subunit [Sphingomonas bacterium]